MSEMGYIRDISESLPDFETGSRVAISAFSNFIDALSAEILFRCTQNTYHNHFALFCLSGCMSVCVLHVNWSLASGSLRTKEDQMNAISIWSDESEKPFPSY